MKIKLVILFVLVDIGTVTNLYSQEKYKSEISIGIKAGTTFSNIVSDTLLTQKLLLGVNGGVAINFISEPHFGTQLELNYTQKGWNEKIDSSTNYKRKLFYLESAFLSRIETGVKSTRLYINLGLFLSYKIDEKSFFDDSKMTKNYYLSKIDNNFEYGVCAGGGFIQKTKIGSFEIEFRYGYSLSNIFKPDHYSSFSSSHNQVISVDLLYLISL